MVSPSRALPSPQKRDGAAWRASRAWHLSTDRCSTWCCGNWRRLIGEIEEMERAIIQVGRHLPGLKRLLQVRGLGLVAAIGVLSESGDVSRFPSAKQLVAYAGLATAVRQSGATYRRGHITKHGRQRLRGFIVEAQIACRM